MSVAVPTGGRCRERGGHRIVHMCTMNCTYVYNRLYICVQYAIHTCMAGRARRRGVYVYTEMPDLAPGKGMEGNGKEKERGRGRGKERGKGKREGKERERERKERGKGKGEEKERRGEGKREEKERRGGGE